MKFTVTMKDPDVLEDAIERAAEKSVLEEYPTMATKERELLTEVRCEVARQVAGQWFEYGEYIDVEVDTDAGTATVLRRGRP